jgi:UDP-glucose 4-epimerase
VTSYLVVGGAGFIGGHLVDRLLADPATAAVTVFDNFSSGRRAHLEDHAGDPRLKVVAGDAGDRPALVDAAAGSNTVVHLASNPDIARAVSEPAIDFDQGTLLTHHVLEAARLAGTRTILYTSGSGVYGDLGDQVVAEDQGSLEPISTYGASKLAGEAMLSAYCHLYDRKGVAFRFANVVGPRQTHGVGFDFLRKLAADASCLEVMGDGSQSKSYLHVSDALDAVLLAAAKSTAPFTAYNVGTDDHLTVREISELAIEVAGIEPGRTRVVFGSADRGWKGDVPVIRLDTRRIRSLGWSNRMSSRQALESSMRAMWAQRG